MAHTQLWTAWEPEVVQTETTTQGAAVETRQVMRPVKYSKTRELLRTKELQAKSALRRWRSRLRRKGLHNGGCKKDESRGEREIVYYSNKE